MSFSQEIKTEVANTKIVQNRKISQIEVLGYILSNVKDLDSNMHFLNENSNVILRYTYIFKNVLDFVVVEDESINKKTKKKIQYMLDIVDIEKYNDNISELKMLQNNIQSKDEMIAFLRGVFLGSGYVLNPKKNYHLELVVNSEITANMIKMYMAKLNLNCNITTRKKQIIVYLKDGNSISELLIMLGANVGVLNLEQNRVVKEMNNAMNRSINCETGNLNRIIKASKGQIEDIETLNINNKIQLLPQGLQDICNIRLKNPEYSLLDIAETLGISKSGINNRFKRIHKIAQEIKKGKNYEGI